MAELRYSQRFIEDMDRVEQPSKVDEIEHAAKLISLLPKMGSRDVPAGIRRRYGNEVRKVPVPPFMIIYEYHEAADLVDMYTLLHEKMAY